MGERLIVQFARGSRRNENFTPHERAAPRPRRTPFRMRIANLPVETSWQVRHPDPWIFSSSRCGQFSRPGLWLLFRVLPVPALLDFWTRLNLDALGLERLRPSVWT